MDARKVIAAFSEEQTEKLTGITKSQLRYWDRTDFYQPSYVEENRRIAFSRVYSFKDIVALRVLNALRNQYRISLQHLREVSNRFRRLDSDTDCWTGTRLFPFNGRVIWYEPGTALPQVVASGQYLTSVALAEVVQDTHVAVQNLHAARDQAGIGTIEKSRYVMHNAAVIAGTRIPVAAIKRFAEAGHSVDDIIREYPDITAADVQAALKFARSSTAA